MQHFVELCVYAAIAKYFGFSTNFHMTASTTTFHWPLIGNDKYSAKIRDSIENVFIVKHVRIFACHSVRIFQEIRNSFASFGRKNHRVI